MQQGPHEPSKKRFVITSALPVILFPYLLLVKNVYKAIMVVSLLYVATTLVNTFKLIKSSTTDKQLQSS